MTEEEYRLRRLRHRRAVLRKKRRERRILLIVTGAALAGAIFFIALANGAFEKRSGENLLTIKEDGTIVYEEIEKTDSDPADVKKFVRSEIEAYNAKNGKNSIRLLRFDAGKESIYLRTLYRDASVYSDFTGYDLFVGKANGARSAGYPADGSYICVRGGKKQEASADAFDSERVVAIREWGLTVSVPGQISAYSEDSDVTYQSSEKDRIKINKRSDGTPAGLTYIFYK